MWDIKDGTYTLSETEDKNTLIFHRKDGEVLNDDYRDQKEKIMTRGRKKI